MAARRMMLVDDNEEVRLLLNRMISEQCFEVLEFEDGLPAYEFLRKETNRDLSFIILDIIMPQMKGTELARRIREEYPTWKIPIIATTGSMDNIEKRYKLYFNDFLFKPFTAGGLAVLNKYI
jgi:CheY-like chemotaxis protein